MDVQSDYHRSNQGLICLGRRAPIRALGIALVVAIMAGLFAPLAQPAAAQRDTDETAEVDELAAEQPQEPAYGGIYVTKYWCEEDYGNASDLYQYCDGTGSATFHLWGDDFDQSYDGGIWQEGLAAGEYTIAEDIPEGYGTPYVFCRLVFITGAESDPFQVDVYDGAISGNLGEGEYLYCDWFNVPVYEEEHEENGSLTIYKFFCPEEAEFDYYSAYLDQLDGYCEFYSGPKVGFDLFHQGNDLLETRYTGSGEDGSAYWESVAGGNATVTEYEQDGFGTPVVICAILPHEEGGEAQYFDVYVEGWTASFDFPHGERVVCYWFNIPLYEEHEDYGSLTIYKFFCPEESEVDYYTADADYLREYCEFYSGPDVTFDLYHEETGETETRSTGNYGEGEAYWELVPGGPVIVTEHAWDGYGDPRVFCGVDYGSGFEYLGVGHSDWSASSYFPNGEHVVCYWFNIPEYEHEDGTITIIKLDCPEFEHDFDPYAAGVEYLGEACYERLNGVEFELYQDELGESSNRVTGDGGEDGIAYWEGVPGGYLTIKEYLPDGYGTPVVFCDVYFPFDEQPPDWEHQNVYDGAISDYYLEPGYSLVCLWFNIPEYDEDGSIIVRKWVCPEGYDYYGLSLEELYEYCYRAEEAFNFHLSDGEGLDQEQSTVAGEASWEGVASGHYVLSEEVPESYSAPIVWCDLVSTEAEWAPERQEVGEGGIAFGYEGGYYFVCDWFNIPYQDESTLHLTKWICPDGYTYEDLAELELYELQELCAEAHEGVEFDLSGDDYYEPRVTDASGEAVWEGFGLGEYSLKEYIPDGYGTPIVWCGWTAYYDGNVYDAFPQPVELYDGNTFGFENTIPGSQRFCFWFNVPYHGGDVDITKWVCPEGYDYHDLSLAELKELCYEVYEGVDFHLLSEDGGDWEETTDGEGKAYWNDLAPGSYGLYEEIPDGYFEPIVWCWPAVVEGDLGYATSPERQDLVYEGAGIQFELVHGMTWTCDWFNIPWEDGGEIVVTKWICPEGYDYHELSLEELLEYCYRYESGWDFHLVDGEGGDSEKTTDETGDAGWSGLEPGAYGVWEELPKGYGEPVVYCWQITADSGDSTAERQELSEGDGIRFELEYGQTWYCYWFNFPHDDDGRGYVKKWVCPEGYTYEDLYELSLEELYELCDEVLVGIDFHLVTEGGDDFEKTTNEAGEAWWGDVGPGHYGLYEEIPDGYGTPIVWCGWTASYEGEVYEDPSHQVELFDGFGIRFDVQYPGTYWYCDWFNIPHHDDGSITIYKWLCPENYDLHAEGANPWEDCEEAFNGVHFEIEGPGGFADEQVTGDYVPGAVKWEDLDEGLYDIREASTAGIIYAFVLDCEGAYFPETYPLYSTDSGEPFVINLGYGEHIVCDWFNVPYGDDEPGKITIYKYWCDGEIISELNCDLYSGGQKFTLTPVGGGAPIELTTGPDGKKSVPVPAGEWELDEVGREWCRAESDDVNADGYLETWEGHETVVVVFNCGDIPTDKPCPQAPNPCDTPTKQPPTKLPNTGSGDAAATIAGETGNAELLGLAVAGIQLLGLAALAARKTRRTRSEVRLVA